MKVTFLTGEYPPMQGGIADYTALLAHHLQALGVQPAVLISQKYPSAADEQSEIPVYPAIRAWNWRCWSQIKGFLQTHPSDVLHIQYQAAAFDLGGWINWLPWYLQRQKQRPKIVTTFHDLRIPYLFPKAGGLRWKTVLALARHSDAVICTNIEDAITLRQFAWGRRVRQIPLGNNVPVNPPEDYNRSEWRRSLGLPDDAFVLAYFGFLNESKGGEDLIKTLANLRQQNINAYLLMIGGDVGDSDPSNAAYARRVKAIIAERNLSERIIFTGYVDLPQVSANLLAADAALMPYRDGVSFRRTTLLAVLNHGLPVISAIPAVTLPQIVAGENMLLAPVGDVSAFTEAIIRIVKDKSLRALIGQGGKLLAEQFRWPLIAEKTVQVYQEA